MHKSVSYVQYAPSYDMVMEWADKEAGHVHVSVRGNADGERGSISLECKWHWRPLLRGDVVRNVTNQIGLKSSNWKHIVKKQTILVRQKTFLRLIIDKPQRKLCCYQGSDFFIRIKSPVKSNPSLVHSTCFFLAVLPIRFFKAKEFMFVCIIK